MTRHPLDRRLLLRLAARSPALAVGAVGGISEAQTPAPLVVIAEITAKPDQTDAFRALFLPFAASVRGEPGCLHYTVLEDEQTPGHFFTYESWADKAALAAAQANTELVRAESCLQDAFATDVRPAIQEWRASHGLPIDPLCAFRESGYLERITKEREGKKTARPSAYA